MTLRSLWLQAITLHAVAFSGVYRAVVVTLASLFMTKENADLFSSNYLVLMFGTSLIGFPAAAVLLERNVGPRTKQIIFIMLFSVSLFYTVYSSFYHLNSGIKEKVFMCVALVSSCIFEINRQILNNLKRYYFLLLISVLSFVTCVFSIYFINEIGAVSYLLVSMAAPAFVSQFLIILLKVEYVNYHSFTNLVGKFTSHSISGALSTSVNYIMPLILIGMLGNQYSSDFAVLSAILGVSVFIPRYISNTFVLSVQSGCQISDCFANVFNKNLLCVLCVAALLQCFMFFYVDNNYAVLSVFSCGVVLSQVSLPYSNVFSVTGKSIFLLKSNVYSGIFLIVSALSLYLLGFLTPLLLALAFLMYQFFKLAISGYYYKVNSW